jgi:queuine tRNA-ribosyltransferase
MIYPEFTFKVTGRSAGKARTGLVRTPHGLIKTPVFMPVGTQGSVKSLTSDDLVILGAQVILGNTYHLYLRPGTKIIKKFGGLHRFMGWDKPLLTDSGGYQVSSLGLFHNDRRVHMATIDEDGVTFKSHLDGSVHRLTPQRAVEIQEVIGADIIMAFDEATPERGKNYARAAMVRTHRWLKESIKKWRDLEAKKKEQGRGVPQALFGIIQGGNYPDLRRESTDFVVEQDLPGLALGGGSIGQSNEQTSENLAWVRDRLPQHKPVYLMGVGTNPQAAVAAVLAGADMFDCVAPTRLARCGLLYTGRLEVSHVNIDHAQFISEHDKGRMDISQRVYAGDERPIEEACDCYTCQKGFSRAYLRHLFKAKELTYYRLASIHNLRMMVRTVDKMRVMIKRTNR